MSTMSHNNNSAVLRWMAGCIYVHPLEVEDIEDERFSIFGHEKCHDPNCSDISEFRYKCGHALCDICDSICIARYSGDRSSCCVCVIETERKRLEGERAK